ncbi:MAG: TatD family hydrolase [Anaerolineales bacterium]
MPTPILVDTHCHLDLDAFDPDRRAVIDRALDMGVKTMLNPSVDLESSTTVVSLAAENEPLFAAVGVHPNDSHGWGEGGVARLRELSQDSKVVAIGEIGLDYYWQAAPKDVQQRAFEEQLDLAAELELPVIVHNRAAGPDVMSILLRWQKRLMNSASPLAERPGVLHSFSGDRRMADQALAAHFFIGLTGPLTFKNAKDLQDLAVDLPLDHLLVETDSPYLSPHPQRGQRNEPARVRLVAEKLAALKGLAFEEVAAATTANTQRLFQFGARS